MRVPVNIGLGDLNEKKGSLASIARKKVQSLFTFVCGRCFSRRRLRLPQSINRFSTLSESVLLAVAVDAIDSQSLIV